MDIIAGQDAVLGQDMSAEYRSAAVSAPTDLRGERLPRRDQRQHDAADQSVDLGAGF